MDTILTHEKTGTVLVHLTESQREALTHIAHEENGACGGYELLEGEETDTVSSKSFARSLKSAKQQTLQTFATFDRQALKDQKALRKARGIGIGLPEDPSTSKDPAVETALLEVREENLKATVQFLFGFQYRNHKTSDGQNAVLAFKTEVEKVLSGGKNSWKLDLIPHRNTPMNSLRLTIPGSSASNEVIVAGGHIDSITQSFFGGGKKAPGADDNASGSATPPPPRPPGRAAAGPRGSTGWCVAPIASSASRSPRAGSGTRTPPSSAMQVPFSSSLRALAAEQGRGLELALVLVLALLLAWGGWRARAEVVLVEVSARASIESVAAAVPVTTLVEGRVEEAQLGLGRRVAAGEVLATLETGRLQLEREGHVAEIAGLRTQLVASEREQAAVAAAVATALFCAMRDARKLFRLFKTFK